MVNTETIGKAQLARLLGCSKARISQLIQQGLPATRSDGLLNREEVLNWVKQHASSGRSRWRNDRDIAGAAELALDAADTFSSELYGAFRQRLVGAPELLLRFDSTVPAWLVLAIVETLDIVTGWAIVIAGADDANGWQELKPLPSVDRRVFDKAGIAISDEEFKAAGVRAEQFLCSLDALLKRRADELQERAR